MATFLPRRNYRIELVDDETGEVVDFCNCSSHNAVKSLLEDMLQRRLVGAKDMECYPTTHIIIYDLKSCASHQYVSVTLTEDLPE